MCSLILHGRRLVKLRKWCNLSVSVQNASPFSNSFSSVASDALVSPRDGRKGNIFTVSYLVYSSGLTTKVAESISEGKANPDSVLSLLSSNGLTESQISTIITIYPGFLILDVKKSLAPKLKFLQSRGASSSELTETVSKVPEILGMKGYKTLSRYYDFFKETLEADKSSKNEKLFHSLPQGKQENKTRNLSALRELGVPQRWLFSLLISDNGLVCGKERFEESLKKVVEMGFDPTTVKFVQALYVVQGWSGKTIEEKVNVYKRLGFDVEDVWAMFKKFPPCIGLSPEMVKKKAAFLVKKMKAMRGCGFNKFKKLLSYTPNKERQRQRHKQLEPLD